MKYIFWVTASIAFEVEAENKDAAQELWDNGEAEQGDIVLGELEEIQEVRE